MIAGQERPIWPVSLYKNTHLAILIYNNTQTGIAIYKIMQCEIQNPLESNILTDRYFHGVILSAYDVTST
jgi:hypothetical protein